jgi:hypothetical protein
LAKFRKLQDDLSSVVNEMENKVEFYRGSEFCFRDKSLINASNNILQEEEFSTTESFCKPKPSGKKNKIFKSVKKLENSKDSTNFFNKIPYSKLDKVKSLNNYNLEREVKVGEMVEQIKERYHNDILKKKLSYLEMANKKVNSFNQIINKRPKNGVKEGSIDLKIESTISNMYNFVENMFEVQPVQSNTATTATEKETCIVF